MSWVLWGNGLLFRAVDSQSSIPDSKLHGSMVDLSFQVISNKYKELGDSVVKSKLSPFSGSAVLT